MAGRASAALCLKYGFADLIGQSTTKETDDDFDYRRAQFFFAFGSYYGMQSATPMDYHPRFSP